MTDVLEHFDLVEADFRREYRTEMRDALRWSERKFWAHVRGLSPSSTFALVVARRAQGPRRIAGAEVDAHFASIAAVG